MLIQILAALAHSLMKIGRVFKCNEELIYFYMIFYRVECDFLASLT